MMEGSAYYAHAHCAHCAHYVHNAYTAHTAVCIDCAYHALDFAITHA